MAGRPAPSRASGGSSGMLYGLIAFSIVTVAALVFGILSMTKVSKLQDDLDRANRQLRTFGSPPEYYAKEAAAIPNGQAFQVMNAAISSLGEIFAGDSNAVAPALRDRAVSALARVARENEDVIIPQGTPIIGALETVSAELVRQRAQTQDMRAKFENAQAQVASLTAQNKSTREEFEAQIASLAERFDDSEKQHAQSLAQKDEQLQEISSSLEAANQGNQQIQRDFASYQRDSDFQRDRRDKQISDLRDQVRGLKQDRFDPDAILKQADGRIVRAIPGSDVVYVNLGARDGASVGLGLEVYSQTGESRNTVRGKASLEVVTVMENTAECRVTRVERGQPILEGDFVVNLAFDRGRLPKFVVRGDFDLDYDGQIDVSGIELVEGMIRQWGGQVVDELDESVDFVVIGLAPRIPTVGGRPTDIVRDQQFHREMKQSRFQELVERANNLSIPIITQNQFLFLTGYAADAVARR